MEEFMDNIEKSDYNLGRVLISLFICLIQAWKIIFVYKLG